MMSPCLRDSLFAGWQIKKRVTRVALPMKTSRHVTMAPFGKFFSEEKKMFGGLSVTAVVQGKAAIKELRANSPLEVTYIMKDLANCM